MGLSRAAIRRVLESNLSQADGVAAVSGELLVRLGGFRPADAAGSAATGMTSREAGRGPAHAVIPNGCPEPATEMPAAPRVPVACLIGQLNERLDLDVLEAVQAAGIAMVLIGPRTDRDTAFRVRLDAFLAAENVRWMGQLSADELRGQLARFGAGMTPYADSYFNRASFPLKTLEYLSAGLGVVSTDMPSARWLNTELVSVNSNPREFALAVRLPWRNGTTRSMSGGGSNSPADTRGRHGPRTFSASLTRLSSPTRSLMQQSLSDKSGSPEHEHHRRTHAFVQSRFRRLRPASPIGTGINR
jgi:teichuronic acid biosynthesis glycosyltransferase TuaH